MRTAIDGAGRVVIPKPIRDRLGLRGGERLEVAERDGIIELRPAPLDVEVVDTPEGPRVEAREPVAEIDDDLIRETLERVRR